MDETNRKTSSGVFKEEASAEEAFASFLEERYGKVVSATRMIVRDEGTAQDIAQEAFARAYIHWAKLWPDGNPVGWIHRVATNLALSLRKRAGRELRAVQRLGKRIENVAAPEVHPELHEAMEKLPPRQRAAVALHYILDLSIDDCAAALKCKSGTVKSLLFNARERLRKELGDE